MSAKPAAAHLEPLLLLLLLWGLPTPLPAQTAPCDNSPTTTCSAQIAPKPANGTTTPHSRPQSSTGAPQSGATGAPGAPAAPSVAATTKSDGLVTRSSNAIYRVLSSVFTHDHHQPTPPVAAAAGTTTSRPTTPTPTPRGTTSTRPPSSLAPRTGAPTSHRPTASPQPVALPVNSTLRPEPKSTTSKPLPSTGVRTHETSIPTVSTLQPTSSINQSESNLDVGPILDSALKVLYALRDSVTKNRPVRLAHHDQPDTDELDVKPAKLVLDSTGDRSSPPTTSEELHLLCKLLHRQLELTNSTVAALTTVSAPTTTSGPQSTTSALNITETEATTSAPTHSQRLVVNSTRDLGESHADHLLESVFARTPIRGVWSATNVESIEESARNTLESLFSRAANLHDPGIHDYPAPASSLAEPSSKAPEVRVHVKAWPRASHLDGARHLHFVYWLLEQQQQQSTPNGTYQVVSFPEAVHLLARLDRPTVEAQLESNRLHQVGSNLVEKFTLPEGASEKPKVIDDELTDASQAAKTPARPSSFQLLVERLSNSSFLDNLHLYLILIFLLVLCVILCIACPLMCCRNEADFGATLRTTRPSDQRTLDPTEKIRVKEAAFDESALWRKLSNTTTTLRRDETQTDRFDHQPGGWRTLENERRLERRLEKSADDQSSTMVYTVSSSRDLWQTGSGPAAHHRQRRRTTNGHHKSSKSAQTSDCPAEQHFADALSDDEWRRQDQLKQHRSDTTTKSELIMVKEKLVPIARDQELQRHHMAATQTSHQPDYVNQRSRQMASLEQMPSRYIDSTPDVSHLAFHQNNLELSQRTQAQVDAIRDELAKVERRDATTSGGKETQPLSSTYKRYDET